MQILESQIKLNEAAYEPATAEADPTEASDASSTDSSPAKEELAKWQAYLGTVRKALSTFKNDDLVVDFANVDDGGSCANLKTVLEQPAKETLNVRGTYSLICNLMDEEPVSVMDLCGTSIAMSPADEKEKAAKEAAAAAAAAAAGEGDGDAGNAE